MSRTFWLAEEPICCAAATSEAMLEIVNNVHPLSGLTSGPALAGPIGIRFADKWLEIQLLRKL